MFFIFSKVLFFLINPLTWVVGGLLFSVLSKKSGTKKYSLLVSILILLLFSNPLLVNQVLKKWEYPVVRPDEIPLVRTGILLGGMTDINVEAEDQIHFNENADRLTESIRLLREGLIQELIITGGSGSLMHHDEKEAQKLKDFLVLIGINSDDITIDSNARNTHENAIEVARILEERGMKDRPILLITSAFHMKRSLNCFEKQGLTTLAYPVDYKASDFDWSPIWLLPSIDALNLWLTLFKEWVGFAAYKMMVYA